VRPDVLVGTLGKAFGVAGAFVAGPSTLRTFLENRARSYVFSTAPPAMLAATTEAAVDLVEHATEARDHLRRLTERLHGALRAQGWPVPDHTSTPILPVLVGDPARTMRLSAALLEQGYFVQGIRPPTVPPGTSRLRVVPTAAHTVAQLDGLIEAFAALRSVA
jgi:7-keto-8-aminopelargonate synthetase-like enzyme